MKGSQALFLVRLTHTLIYLVMVAAIAVLLYAGISGYSGLWLWISLGLLGFESVVFVGKGMKCPLTAVAVRFGAEKGYAFDTLLPERATRYTFRLFGTLMIAGLALMVLRWTGVLGGAMRAARVAGEKREAACRWGSSSGPFLPPPEHGGRGAGDRQGFGRGCRDAARSESRTDLGE